MHVLFEPETMTSLHTCKREGVESMMIMCALAPAGNEGVQTYAREFGIVSWMPARPIVPAGSGEIDIVNGGIPPVQVILTGRQCPAGGTSFSTS